MKTATSAGGVIVNFSYNQWYVLIIKDMNGAWTFPKGMIEQRETAEEAALREIQEEVCISKLSLLCAFTPIQYTYTRSGLITKTVYYFLFQSILRMKPTVQREEGIKEAKWVSIPKATDMIGYRDTNVKLLEETWKLLQLRTYKN